MMLYKIGLCLMILGAVSAVIQDTGFYPVNIPQTSAKGITEAEVIDLANNVENAPINPLSSLFMLQMIIHVLISAFLALITIIPFLTAYGCPLGLAVIIQTPIWLVMAWGLYQMWTGHASMGMD